MFNYFGSNYDGLTKCVSVYDLIIRKKLCS